MTGESVRSCYSIRQTAANIAAISGIEAPRNSAPPMECVLSAAKHHLGGRTASRVLMYNPDAIALWLYKKYMPLFSETMTRANLTLPLTSVMPSVTPVCFASMYSGLEPSGHGIQSYTKPRLTCDTLFDREVAAGKKCALVSTTGDSMSLIFLGRDIEYYIYDTPEECNARAMELLREDRHDLIALYNTDYDATMHRNAPESAASLEKLEGNCKTFAALVDLAEKTWAAHDFAAVFAPDHGCHEIDGGLGSHGLDMDEDMEVVHFYAFRAASR